MTGDLGDLMRAAAERAPRPDGLAGATRERFRRRQHRQRRFLAGGTAVVVTATATGTAVLHARVSGRPVGHGASAVLPGAPALPQHDGSLAPSGGAAPSASDVTTSPAPASATVSPSVSVSPPPAGVTSAGTGASLVTAPGSHGCNEGFSRDLAPAVVAAQLGLLSSDPSYRLQGAVRVQGMTSYCPSAALPLIYQRIDGGVVAQALSLTGPIPQSPAGAGDDHSYVGAVGVQVRGRTGQLVTFASDLHLLTWAEPDGTHWSLEGSRISTAQLTAIADGLTLTGTVAADASTLPPGLTQLPAVPSAPAGELPTWWATYQRGSETFRLEIRQTPGGISPYMVGAAGGNRVVEVSGHSAQINTAPGPTASDTTLSLQWAEHPDVLVAIMSQGDVTDQEVQAFAASLTPVTAHDPRLN